MLRVKNDKVWNQIKVLFLGSAFLFLANIYFGFDNALTAPDIPRWQALVHAHAGTLGWITLSVISFAIWILTGEREVSDSYVRKVTNLTRLGIGIFAGYIISFGLAFSGLGNFYFLLPIFGVSASLYIWAAAIFSVSQTRQQPVVTSTHLLITAALLVAALGSTVGVLLGLEYALGNFFIPGSDRIGAHAAVMDSYLLLAAASIIEFFLQKDAGQRWNRSGLFLVIVWSISMLSIETGLLGDIVPLIMLSAPLMLLAMIVFVVRGGWRGLKFNPLRKGYGGWVFFGTLWTIVWGLFFIWVAATYAEDITAAPWWVFITFSHLGFIGTMTNLLLGIHSARSQAASQVLAWAELPAVWLVNLGLVVFLGLEITSGSTLGAIVMGIGVLLGVLTMILRLQASKA